MSKETSLVLHSISDANEMATTLAKSKLVPDAFKDKPSDVFMAITYGQELGMPAVTSLMSIAVIKGKPTLYAHAMVALVLNSEKAEYFHCVESSARHAIYETRRKGSPQPRRYEFNEEMAKAAGLLGGNYSKYGQQMYEARAKAYLAKDVYPDVLHGMMSAEEAQHTEPDGVDTDRFEAPAEDAEIVEDAEGLLGQIHGSETLDAIHALVPQLKELSGGEREEALAAYKMRLEELKAQQ